MNIFRIYVKKSKEIPNKNGAIHKYIQQVISELEISKVSDIQVNGNIITFKNINCDWRLDRNVLGVLKEGKFELSETADIIINLDTFFPILGDSLVILLMALIGIALSDMSGLLFLLLIPLFIIYKKAVVSVKLEELIEEIVRKINGNRNG